MTAQDRHRFSITKPTPRLIPSVYGRPMSTTPRSEQSFVGDADGCVIRTLAKPLPWTLNSSVNLEMIWVEPGTFTMGSPAGEACRGSTRPSTTPLSPKAFTLGKYEVTQAQYEAVMTGNGNGLSATPSQWSGKLLNRPVGEGELGRRQIFARLNALSRRPVRLPAGWSCSAHRVAMGIRLRAGTTTAYSWGATIASSNANYNWDAGQRGKTQPNP